MGKNNTYYDHMFYKTFSGTDSLAFMLLPECKPILLGSLTTISYSMYRDKKPVTLIGKVNVSGFTRGMRVIAGSMVFTLINQHLSKDLSEQVPYLSEHGKIKADELPLFDIMIISSNEYGSATRMMIYGVDITDDSQVLSIQDLFTENTFNFVARDVDEFTAYKGLVVNSNGRASTSINTVMPCDFDIDSYESAVQRISKNIKNEELMTVQSELVKKGLITKVSGVYDNETVVAIKRIQLEHGLNQTGMLDRTTYDVINLKDESKKVITITSPNGAFVYGDKNKDKVNGIAKCNDSFIATEHDEFYSISFFGSNGYISKSDVHGSVSYDVTFLSKQGNVTVKRGNYSKVGIEIMPSTDIDLKISAISKYGEDSDCFSKYKRIERGKKTTISLEDMTDAYIYNLSKKSKPDKITFIILCQGVFIYKWEVQCSE